jgi:hypothetical protein
MWVTSVCNFEKKLLVVNNRPIGENSPKRRKFAQSGHPANPSESFRIEQKKTQISVFAIRRRI